MLLKILEKVFYMEDNKFFDYKPNNKNITDTFCTKVIYFFPWMKVSLVLFNPSVSASIFNLNHKLLNLSDGDLGKFSWIKKTFLNNLNHFLYKVYLV